MKMIYKSVLALTCLSLLGGCAMAPQYEQPAMPVAKSLEGSLINNAADMTTDNRVENVALLHYDEIFLDADLQELISTALENNKSLKQTAINLEIYQAQYRIQRSALYPSINGTGYGTKQRTLGSTGMATSEVYSLEVAATSWELDFFGRIRSLKDQALENYLAMEETQKSAKSSLVAEVARAYLTLLTDKELLTISEDTRKIEQESYDLIEQRVNAGISDQLDLAQARTSLEAVKVNLPLYRRQVAQDIHYLTLLTGGKLPKGLLDADKTLEDVTPMAVLPTSLSSEILLQRPDIKAAEHSLIGANANIGAARAAFFPRISLTAGAGFISPELENLFDGDTGSYRFTPSISIPIFNAGQLKAQLDVAELQKELSVVQYESAIETAFQEVSDALVALETYQEQLDAQKANLDANQQYYDHARSRYEEGVDSFLTLLIAQRSLYSAKQNYLAMQLSNLTNKVNLFKVLGGGWNDSAGQQ